MRKTAIVVRRIVKRPGMKLRKIIVKSKLPIANWQPLAMGKFSGLIQMASFPNLVLYSFN
jgi:hypothetical protein